LWDIAPSEFWKMTPGEWWRIYDMKHGKSVGSEEYAGLSENDCIELYNLLEMEE
jgi:hypothetical protein